MGFDSPIHWIIVIGVIALLFGGSRVGSLMGELGKGVKAFKQNIADDRTATTATPPPPATNTAPPALQRTETMAEPAPAPPSAPTSAPTPADNAHS
ncbi:MAG: twin-arginine translocase TatA/TatE family subunit [Acidiphilium sp.]